MCSIKIIFSVLISIGLAWFFRDNVAPLTMFLVSFFVLIGFVFIRAVYIQKRIIELEDATFLQTGDILNMWKRNDPELESEIEYLAKDNFERWQEIDKLEKNKW